MMNLFSMPSVAGALASGVYRLINNMVRPYTLLLLLIGLALVHLWRRRRESRARLLLVILPFGGLYVLSLPAVSYLALGSLEWGYPPRESRPEGAGAVVVLSGAVLPRDAVRPRDELGESTLYRCLEAARVYRDGPPLPVVAAGGDVNPDDSNTPCAVLMAEFLRSQGVRSSDLIIEGHARSTHENALETRKLLDRRDIHKIILVTDATHMRRSVLCFRKQGFEVIPWPCHLTATEFRPAVSLLLPSPGAAVGCLTAAHEWMGIAWYGLTGKI